MNSRLLRSLAILMLMFSVSALAAAQCTRCGPGLIVSPQSLTFAPQVVGTNSAAMTVMLRSVGIFPVTFNSIASSGPPFSETNNCPHSLPRNAICRIRVTFAPTAIGTFNGVITITDNAGKQIVTLTGTGVAAVAYSPANPSLDKQLVAQVDAQQESRHKSRHHHYRLIDLGTFGGPQSYVNIPDISYAQVLNNHGTVSGWADQSAPDPFPDCCFDGDCFVAHALQVRQRSLMKDLGALPGGASSQGNWISSNGLIAGISQNGAIDPLVPGFPELRAVVWNHHGIVDLGTLDGGYESIANAVNSRGQVVGFSTTTIPDADSMFGLGYQTRAVLWQKGMIHDLGTLGTGTNAVALLVNERGQIAGNSYTSAEPSEACAQAEIGSLTTGAFLWDKGMMLDLGSFGGTCTFALDLNSHGQVVGGSRLAGDQAQHPFLWDQGSLVDLGTLGGNLGTGIAINDGGEVAGWSTLPGDQTFHAALWRHGRLKDLGTVKGDADSVAFHINALGQVVGVSIPPGGDFDTSHAFLWEEGGPMIDLNKLIPHGSSLRLTEPATINDRGEIAGNGFDADGNQHAFMLIPCDDDHGENGCDGVRQDGAPSQAERASVTFHAMTDVKPNKTQSGMVGRRAGFARQRLSHIQRQIHAHGSK